MRICVWNVHGAIQTRSDVWDYLLEINTDLILLQEVGSLPIDPTHLEGIDTRCIKLINNPNLWLTEIIRTALSNEDLVSVPWIVAGDLNSSVTFDYLWGKKPRGNQEIQDRMLNLGFFECLLTGQGQLTPTFKNPRGGNVIHQMDHLYAPEHMKQKLISCIAGNDARVFGESVSDHLPIIADFE